MTIIYRDDLGYVEIEIPETEVIDFLDGNVYFADCNGNDYVIPMSAIVRIGK